MGQPRRQDGLAFGWIRRLTVEDVQVDGGWIGVGWLAGIFARIGEAGVAQQQRRRRLRSTLVRHDGHTAARRVVSQYLMQHTR